MTASPSLAAKWLVLRLHRFQEQCSEVDVRISATDDVVDLTKGDFDIAVRYGTGNYPGLDVELLFTNEVFPACSPQLLTTGPPLRTPDDLPLHNLIHDQAIERDPLVPTWPMWLKAAGVKNIPETSGQATAADSRIFSGGHFLRRFSIDEIPQFLNVLKGSMSVVGPRPHLIEHNHKFGELLSDYHIRAFVKPGITGLAQVRGFRGESTTREDIAARLRSDLIYLENWSLILELSIIVRTVWHVLFPPKTAR